MTILVLGSLNMDLVVRSPRLPHPGETLTGRDFATIPGGKGANEAVAAARQGVATAMMGRVGADDFGHQLRHALAGDGINIDAVKVDAETHTGVAAIVVAKSGENQIVIVPGANSRLDTTDLAALENALASAQLLLLQCEIPAAMVAQAAQLAHAAGVTVMLDPAPVPAFDLTPIYSAIDILTPNQIEAAQLTGLPVNNVAEAEAAIAHLQRQGASTILIKLGEQGVLCGTPTEMFHVPAFPVSVVDTVAAGDAFNGGLAVALAEGRSLKQAVMWASATAALSVSQAGAQPSMPTRSQVAEFLRQANTSLD
ncbi:ribokinase [Halomicronema sp. CCY15110]|uniref:ribokinase n=1 Tax=Halomicronema sp. CCY15110 TaxID=2767773 RepID=UPI0019523628|nr:ribokinase [Halomicronema sp. CCY15110]